MPRRCGRRASRCWLDRGSQEGRATSDQILSRTCDTNAVEHQCRVRILKRRRRLQPRPSGTQKGKANGDRRSRVSRMAACLLRRVRRPGASRGPGGSPQSRRADPARCNGRSEAVSPGHCSRCGGILYDDGSCDICGTTGAARPTTVSAKTTQHPKTTKGSKGWSFYGVIRDPTLPNPQHRVLLVVLSHLGRKDKAWPSVALIATESRLSVSQTRRTLRELERLGYLQTVFCNGRSNWYRPGPLLTTRPRS